MLGVVRLFETTFDPAGYEVLRVGMGVLLLRIGQIFYYLRGFGAAFLFQDFWPFVKALEDSEVFGGDELELQIIYGFGVL